MEIKENTSSRLYLQTSPLPQFFLFILWAFACLPWVQLLIFLSIFTQLEKAFRLEKIECQHTVMQETKCQIDYVGIPLFGKTNQVKFQELKQANFEQNTSSRGNNINQIELQTERGKFILFHQNQDNANLINQFIADKNKPALLLVQDNRRAGIVILVTLPIVTILMTLLILYFIPHQYAFIFDKSTSNFTKITYCLGKTWCKNYALRNIDYIKINPYRIKTITLFFPFIYLKSGKKIRVDLSILYTRKNMFVSISSEETKAEAEKIAGLIGDFLSINPDTNSL